MTQMKKAATDIQAACCFNFWGSSMAKSWSVMRFETYPCGVQGFLQSGFVASSFEDFFSRFGVFFNFNSGSLQKLTHRA
jgi:hypothetical protein